MGNKNPGAANSGGYISVFTFFTLTKLPSFIPASDLTAILRIKLPHILQHVLPRAPEGPRALHFQ